jgi:lipopolysaccharide export system permease protein
MWLSSFVLLPVGVYITVKASADSATLSLEAYQRFFKRLFPLERVRKLVKNKVGKNSQEPQP